MENSADALFMAALVLIGVILLSIFVAVFASTGNFAKNVEDGMRNTQVQKFNNQFEQYFTLPDDTKKSMNGHDIVSLINLAIETNIKAGYAVIEKITVNGAIYLNKEVKDGTVSTVSSYETKLLQDTSDYLGTASYDSTGRINTITLTLK